MKTNSTDFRALDRGAQEMTVSLSGHHACFAPSFVLPLAEADAPEVTVAFEDPEDRISATFHHLGSGLSLALTPPADGHFLPGTTMGLSYQPATDDLSEQIWTLFPDVPNGGASAIPVPKEAFQQGRGELAIPSDFPVGPAYVQIRGIRRPQVLSCEGAIPVGCDANYHMGGVDSSRAVFDLLRVDLQIEP